MVFSSNELAFGEQWEWECHFLLFNQGDSSPITVEGCLGCRENKHFPCVDKLVPEISFKLLRSHVKLVASSFKLHCSGKNSDHLFYLIIILKTSLNSPISLWFTSECILAYPISPCKHSPPFQPTSWRISSQSFHCCHICPIVWWPDCKWYVKCGLTNVLYSCNMQSRSYTDNPHITTVWVSEISSCRVHKLAQEFEMWVNIFSHAIYVLGEWEVNKSTPFILY